MGYNWLTWDVNYDNIGRAMMSHFILSNEEGWPNFM